MKTHTLIFCSIVFITKVTNAMEIIKKNNKFTKVKHQLLQLIVPKEKKLPKTTYQQHNSYHPITNELLFTHTMHKRNIFPRDITQQIIWYCAVVRFQELIENKKLFWDQWNDFRIPLMHLFFLTQEQMHLMPKLFNSIRYGLSMTQDVEMYHVLESKIDYKLFLTLPIELRQCLTLLPRAEIHIKSALNLESESLDSDTPIDINENRTIQVKNNKHGSTLRSIVPEEKTKNVKLDINH
jgi:hypothetical protein